MRRSTDQPAAAADCPAPPPPGTARGPPHGRAGERATPRAPHSTWKPASGAGTAADISDTGPATVSSGPMVLTPSTSSSVLHSDQVRRHRVTCHRCGNIRRSRTLCGRCPQSFCKRCTGKLVVEHGPAIFRGGCPMCKELCCCARRHDTRIYDHCPATSHCYKKCPMSGPGKRKSGGDAVDGAAAGADVATQGQEMMREQAAARRVGAALGHRHPSAPRQCVAPPPRHLWPGNMALRTTSAAHPPPPPRGSLQPRVARGAVGRRPPHEAREPARHRIGATRPPGGNFAPAAPSPKHKAARVAASKPEDMHTALFIAVGLELERIDRENKVHAPRTNRKRIRAAWSAGGDCDAGGEEDEEVEKDGENEGGERQRRKEPGIPPPRARRRNQTGPTVTTTGRTASDTPAPPAGSFPARPLPLDPMLRVPAVPVLSTTTRRADSRPAAHREPIARGGLLVVGGLALGPHKRVEAEPSLRWQRETALRAHASSQRRHRIRLRTRHEQRQRAAGTGTPSSAPTATSQGLGQRQTGNQESRGARREAGGPWTGFGLLPRPVNLGDPHSAASTFSRRYGCGAPGALHVAIARHVLHARTEVVPGTDAAAQSSGDPASLLGTPLGPVSGWEPLGVPPAAEALRCSPRQRCGPDPASAPAPPAVTASPRYAATWSNACTSSVSSSDGQWRSSAEAHLDGVAPGQTAPQRQQARPTFPISTAPAMALAAGPAAAVAAAHCAPAWMRGHGPHMAAFGGNPYAARMMQLPMMAAPGQETAGAMPGSTAPSFASLGMWGPTPFYPVHHAFWPSMPNGGFPHA